MQSGGHFAGSFPPSFFSISKKKKKKKKKRMDGWIND